MSVLVTTWEPPNMEHELSEVFRTSAELGVPIESLLRGVDLGTESDLEGEQWTLLQNTDSCEELSYEQARELATEYDRDLDGLLQAMAGCIPIPMPLVLDHPVHGLYLVGGNTRLMACRVLSITPKVWKFRAVSEE